MSNVMYESNFLGFGEPRRGKVRDVYDLGDILLIVATDRISAFDVVMPTPIPDKGGVLTRLSVFYLRLTESIVENHLLTADVTKYPEFQLYKEQLVGRSMLVRKVSPLPVECIVRGYIIGSGWKDYQRTGKVCGIALPPNLQEAEKLPEPIFTPSTKAAMGQHDENISFARMAKLIGVERAKFVRKVSLSLYERAAEYAAARGIILADTKFEFGELETGQIILIDEVLTPDSSRFWPADRYQVGSSPPSFDKQYLRDYLVQSGWKPSDPPLELPEDVVGNTRSRYLEALKGLSPIP